MDTNYVAALETRLGWWKWAGSQEARETCRGHLPHLECYRSMLRNGDTFFMDRAFCDLVDYARRTIPDDLAFEKSWVFRRSGWMLMETPFDVPEFVRDIEDNPVPQSYFKVAAISWELLPNGTTNVACYLNAVSGRGFMMWTWFAIDDGDRVVDRIHRFEKDAAVENGVARRQDGLVPGTCVDGKQTDVMHEIRWVYTAMHLMSQKLATTVRHRGDRSIRRRWERDKSVLLPELNVVTLRRMQEARDKDPHGTSAVDWQWQWAVQGHWRNQWYPSDRAHKTKWIEDYVKGPVDKPMKPVATVFNVKR